KKRIGRGLWVVFPNRFEVVYKGTSACHAKSRRLTKVMLGVKVRVWIVHRGPPHLQERKKRVHATRSSGKVMGQVIGWVKQTAGTGALGKGGIQIVCQRLFYGGEASDLFRVVFQIENRSKVFKSAVIGRLGKILFQVI